MAHPRKAHHLKIACTAEHLIHGGSSPGKECPQEGIHCPIEHQLGNRVNDACMIGLHKIALFREPFDKMQVISWIFHPGEIMGDIPPFVDIKTLHHPSSKTIWEGSKPCKDRCRHNYLHDMWWRYQH